MDELLQEAASVSPGCKEFRRSLCRVESWSSCSSGCDIAVGKFTFLSPGRTSGQKDGLGGYEMFVSGFVMASPAM